MAWEIKPARDAFPSFAAEWDRLNQEIYRGHPMFDSRFIGPLLECFAKGDEQLCIHRSTTEADGALILRPTGLGRWTLFLPAQAQAGTVLLGDARLMETLLPTLPGFAWLIELLALDPQYSPDWTHLRLPRTVQPHALTMAVEVSDRDFDAYWRARPSSLMKNLRPDQRRAEGQFGAFSLVTIGEPQEMKAAVSRYGALEVAGCKGRAGTAISIDNAQGHFYEKVLRDFAATGQAKVLELHVGGKLAASRLMILNERLWIMLKTSYDESIATAAPGPQLLHEALRQAFRTLTTGSVEFHTDATRDQAEWATSLRRIRHHQLYRGELPAAILGVAQTLRTWIFRRTARADSGADPNFDPTSVKRYASPQDFTPDTIRLFETSSRQNIEFSLGWFDNLQRSVFTDDPGVRYYVAELAGMPIAALPLRLARNGPVRRIEALGNFYTSLYAPILGPASTSLDLVPLLDAANRDHHGAHVMQFAPMDPDSPTFEALLTALRSVGWLPFRYFSFGNWYLKADKSWPEYLKERKSKLRNTIKRMNKMFAAEGGTLEIATEAAQVEAAARAYNDVYAASWKQPEPYSNFVPGLLRRLAAQNQLRLGIARLEGRPIAAQIWTVHGSKAHIFKVAYDEAFSRFSSGTLLTAHLMERVIDLDGVQEVDYLIGDDPYKKSWMSHRRERWGIVAYNPRTFTGLALLAQEIIGRTIRIAMQMTRSRLTIPARSVRGQIRKVRSEVRAPPAPSARPSAVVVGLCAHGLGIVRDLDCAGIKVIGLESNPSLPGVTTQHAEIRLVPKINGEALVDTLCEFAGTYGFKTKPVLLLTNDRMVEAVGHHSERISDYYHLSWAKSAASVLRLLGKDQIEKRCHEVGLNYPRSGILTDLTNVGTCLEGFNFPIIIKPTRPLSAFKTIVVDSIDGLNQHRLLLEQALPVLVQEFIAGDDTRIRFGALYLREGLVLARFEGRKLCSRPMGHTTIAVSEPNENVYELTRKFFDGLGMSGPVSLEMKEGPDGQFWVIEPTVGRTDFWAGLCTANGINLSLYQYLSTLGSPVPIGVQEKTTIWINGERHPGAVVWLLRHSLALLLRHRIRGVYWDWQDRKPFFIAARRHIRALPVRAMSKLLSRPPLAEDQRTEAPRVD